MVAGRWEIIIVVLPVLASASARTTCSSRGASTAEVASSSTRTRGSASKRAGQGDALALPAREREPSFADLGLVPERQLVDELVRLGQVGGLGPVPGVRGPGPPDPQVGGDGVVEKETVLEDDRHRLAQARQAEVATSTPSRDTEPRPGVVQAGQQGQDGRLARAGGAHHGHHFAAVDGQVEAVQRQPVVRRRAAGRRVRELDVGELHRARPGGSRRGSAGSATALCRFMMVSRR